MIMQRMDRSQLGRDLAKAAAYVDCGKPDKAAQHLACLMAAFREAGVDVREAFSLAMSVESQDASEWLDAPVSTREPEAVVYDLSDASRRLGSQLL